MPRRAISGEVQELVDNVYSVLRRMGGRVDIIEYPSTQNRAIDLVSGKGEQRIFARVVLDIGYIERKDVEELKASASLLGASPIIVGRYVYGYAIEESVAYEKHGIHAVNVETLESVLCRGERIYVYNTRGIFLVKINREKFRERRRELGLSLGELARLTGVSRKAIYEYERGTMDLSIDKAIKIAEILGYDVLDEINILEPPSAIPENKDLKSPDTHVEKEAMAKLEKKGFKVVHLKRTPIDLLARKGRETIAIIVKHFISDKKFKQKINEAEKIVSLTESKEIVLEKEDDVENIINS